MRLRLGVAWVSKRIVVVAVDFECSSLRGEKWMRKALGYKYQRFPFTGKVYLVQRLVGSSLCSVGLFRSKEILKIFCQSFWFFTT